MAPSKRGALVFGNGTFVSVTSQVLWLAAFFAGIAACALGVTYPPRPSAYELPGACAAGKDTFDALFLCCFAALVSCVVQACCVTLSQWVLGSKKRVHRLPLFIGRWCRALSFASVLFCAVSLGCVIGIVHYIVVVRVGKFGCLKIAAQVLVVAADVAASVAGVFIFLVGSYGAWCCN